MGRSPTIARAITAVAMIVALVGLRRGVQLQTETAEGDAEGAVLA
jgi:hypothetical protein